MKVKVSYGKCYMVCTGIDSRCPLCDAGVKSGTSHYCERKPETKKLKSARKDK